MYTIMEDDGVCLGVEIPNIEVEVEVEEAAAGTSTRGIADTEVRDVVGAPVHLGAEVVVEVEVQQVVAINLTSSVSNKLYMKALLKPKMMEVEKLGHHLNHHRMKK